MPERKPPPRYPRPALEIEVDQQKLLQPSCCRFVPVVIRLVNISSMDVSLDITFWRERMRDQAGAYIEDYQTHPRFCHPPTKSAELPGNAWEISTELLARAHESETGTVSIAMSSPSGTELSKAEYRLDTRCTKLTQNSAKGFTNITIFDHILSDEERLQRVDERERLRTFGQALLLDTSPSTEPNPANQPTLF